MANTLPLPLRVAAGVVGTTIDRLTRLPSELPGLGVSLAGHVLRTSMRIRQEVADLATRGDELFGDLAGGRSRTGLATFDEDLPDPVATGPDHRDAHRGDTDGVDTAPSTAAPPSAAEPAAADHPPTAPKRPRDRSRTVPGAGSGGVTNGATAPHTVAELRAKIRDLPADAVRELLVAEQAGPARAAWITLLENRLTTLGQPAS